MFADTMTSKTKQRCRNAARALATNILECTKGICIGVAVHSSLY